MTQQQEKAEGKAETKQEESRTHDRRKSIMGDHIDFMQIGIAVFVSGIITYLIVTHTGLEDGQIKPDMVYAFFTGIFATKIVDFIYKSVVRNANK